MALPKRQHSRQRGRKRRTHWKVTMPSFSTCPSCQKQIIPHRICPFCGTYKGQQVITVKAKKEKQSEE